MATHDDRACRVRSLALMAAPRLWPTYPFLPVRRAGGDGLLELGVLYEARGLTGRWGYSSTVFRANLFMLPPSEDQFLHLPRYVYDTLDELLDDGWRIG